MRDERERVLCRQEVVGCPLGSLAMRHTLCAMQYLNIGKEMWAVGGNFPLCEMNIDDSG